MALNARKENCRLYMQCLLLFFDCHNQIMEGFISYETFKESPGFGSSLFFIILQNFSFRLFGRLPGSVFPKNMFLDRKETSASLIYSFEGAFGTNALSFFLCDLESAKTLAIINQVSPMFSFVQSLCVSNNNKHSSHSCCSSV